MIQNTDLINIMNKDQDLIFEAYTQTLTEGWEAGTSKAPKGKSYDMSRGGAPSSVDAAKDGSGGRYRNTRPPSAQSNKTHGEMEEEDDNDQYAPEDAPEDDQFEGMEPEEDESVGDSSDFEDKAEKFADSIGDAELEYLVNLSGEEFERLKGFLQDQMGYRDLGQYKLN